MAVADFKPTVFISSSSERLQLARELAHQLEPYAQPILWSDSELFSRGLVTSDVLARLRGSDFAICLFDTPAPAFGQYRQGVAGRDNVFFELGLLVGNLGPDRVLIVVVEDSPESFCFPSDLVGLRTIRFGPAYKSPQITAERIAREVRHVITRVEPRPEQNLSSYSCFISYVHHDKRFVNRLYEDLLELGVRCWLDDNEIHTGEVLQERIEAGLRTSDKVIAILSRHAVASRWFRKEIDIAIEFEQQGRETFLFPVRIDDTLLEEDDRIWQAVQSRHIADFSDWSDPRSYRRAFARLAKDLTLSFAIGEGRQ